MERGRCQVCGSEKRLTKAGLVPKHKDCAGSHQLPLERDTAALVTALHETLREGDDDWRVQVLVRRLISVQPEAERAGLEDAYESLRALLRSLSELTWLMKAVEEYGHCRVCGKEVDKETLRFAMRRFEKPTCGTDCYKREIIQRYACCEKAEFTPCVCMYSFKCPEHGERHIGTHD